MKEKIKVIIVDDSDFLRPLLKEGLEQDENIEVISEAKNGKLAIPRIKHYQPDFVILDYEMPELNGLETLKEIKQLHFKTNVIMFSAHTIEGAKITLEALNEGAIDFIEKPNSLDNPNHFFQYIQNNLILKIKTIYQANQQNLTKTSQTKKSSISSKKNIIVNHKNFNVKSHYDFCAIGISTGGPTALRELFAIFSKNLNGSILIVQHMPPIFTEQLAMSLNQHSKMNVKEAQDNEIIQKGWAYIAPGGKHLTVKKDNNKQIKINILDTAPVQNCKPSVNVLFESIAKEIGSNAIGVIMTGMGDDGYIGMKQMKENHSFLLAQSKESCVVYGMPEKAISNKIVHEVHDVQGLGKRVEELLK